jgi:hypothetical protein
MPTIKIGMSHFLLIYRKCHPDLQIWIKGGRPLANAPTMSNDSITINSDAFTPLTSESSDGTKQKEFREKDALRKREEHYKWSSDKREEVNLSRRRRGQAQRESLTETERKQLNDRQREREKMKLQLMSEEMTDRVKSIFGRQ